MEATLPPSDLTYLNSSTPVKERYIILDNLNRLQELNNISYHEAPPYPAAPITKVINFSIDEFYMQFQAAHAGVAYFDLRCPELAAMTNNAPGNVMCPLIRRTQPGVAGDWVLERPRIFKCVNAVSLKNLTLELYDQAGTLTSLSAPYRLVIRIQEPIPGTAY